MPVFRSGLQARLLLEVLTRDSGSTAADLARVLEAPPATVSREARRLVDAGLLRATRVGRAAVLRPVETNPATAPLRQLLLVTFGPRVLIRQRLGLIEGVEEAYIHGSWAARSLGVPGPSPGDVDVVVVGAVSRRDVDVALEGLESRIGREVNVTYVSVRRWSAAQDVAVASIRSGPLIRLLPAND